MQQYIYNLATDKYSGPVAAVIKAFLFVFSLVYGSIIRTLIFFYRIRPCRLDCKVISVGNITLGGTGKTTLVESIALFLKQQGHKTAILSRGYKRKITSYELPACRQAGEFTSYEEMGDEPFMLSRKMGDIPVIVDADRIRAAKQAIKDYSVNTVILDDGFQQWRIKKDLEIVSIDATNPFGNRQMIPRGILREPISSLRRADIFVLTKTNLSKDVEAIRNYLSRINPNALIAESIHKPLGFYNLCRPDEQSDICSLEGKVVTLFSGIGDPDSFEKIIKILGARIGLSFRFRDHHHYTREDLDKIFKSSREKKIDTIITTEKDAARLASFLPQAPCPLPVLVLCIGLVFTKEEEKFCDRLLKLYSL